MRLCLLWGGDLVRWLQPLYIHETMYCSTMLLNLDNELYHSTPGTFQSQHSDSFVTEILNVWNLLVVGSTEITSNKTLLYWCFHVVATVIQDCSLWFAAYGAGSGPRTSRQATAALSASAWLQQEASKEVCQLSISLDNTIISKRRNVRTSNKSMNRRRVHNNGAMSWMQLSWIRQQTPHWRQRKEIKHQCSVTWQVDC